MKKIVCIAVLVFLLTGCGSKTPSSPEVPSRTETPRNSAQSELSQVSSQFHHDEVAAAFLNSMGCSDKNCTDETHFHHCPADCGDYDHYHTCSLDCTETSHHHSGHTAESSHKEQHNSSHSDSHH